MLKFPGVFHVENRRYVVDEGVCLFQHHFPLSLLFDMSSRLQDFVEMGHLF
jgi:hypothetical protein